MTKVFLAIFLIGLIAGCAVHVANAPVPSQTVQVPNVNVTTGFYKVMEQTTMFENADPGSRKLDRIDAGVIVQVVDVAGSFAQIKYSENAGWVLSDQIEDAGANGIVRTIGKTKVKASPDGYSDDVAILESGRLLTMKKKNGDWVFVKISENRGWVMSGLLEPIEQTGSRANTASSQGVFWRTVKKANLRGSPNTVSEILRSLPENAVIEYLGTEGDWVRVKYDGTVGYVRKDLVSE
jgi:SH3-like domain-containing protein